MMSAMDKIVGQDEAILWWRILVHGSGAQGRWCGEDQRGHGNGTYADIVREVRWT